MISHHNTPRRADASRPMLLVVTAALLLGLLSYGTQSDSAAQECPEGSVLSDNGVTCELDVSEADSVCPEGKELDAAGLMCVDIDEGNPESVCPEGQQLDAAGLLCVDSAIANADPTDPCSPGQELDEAGLRCIDSPDEDGDDDDAQACDPGYSLGADRETCIADGPKCENDEVLDTDGTCVKTFRCSPGLILASNLLSCLSDGCPDGELLAVDGRRCLAPDSNCPDGSPRPIGGACLVVETIEGEDGTEVVVRCDAADSFCQARIKLCAEDRAAGAADLEAQCEDPRGSCDDQDDECALANDRLVECATREKGEDDDRPVAIGRADDPCDDLCPSLHRLDPSGECVEFLDPKHPCVSFGRVPAGVTTNDELNGYSYLAGTGQCVTRGEFLRRLGNFEAAAGAEADALTLLRETTSSYLTVEGQLAELEQRLVDTERDVRAFSADAAEADAARADNIKSLAATQKRLERERQLLRSEVVGVFVLGGTEVAIETAVLHATNVTEIGVARAYGRALLDDQVNNIERIERLEAEAVDLALALDQALAEVQASLAAAVSSSESLDTLLNEAERLRADQLARRDEEAELVAELRANKAQFAQELGVFEQASREIADIIADTEFRVTTFAEFDGLLANPILPETVITSGFGPRLHPILGYVRNHNGVDITAGFGEEILASGAGVVQIARDFGGYGKTVVIDHGGDILTLYAHQSATVVDVGEEVELGQIIGYVGSTGLSTGPHLHFEVWENGETAVDPRPYLSDASSG